MRLIDADAMRQDWVENGKNEYVYDTNSVLDSIDAQPTIEAEPVKHGRWLICSDGYYPYCSECKEEPYRKNNCDLPNYCPNCGARMRR